MSPYKRLAALGSSFAAGPTLEPVENLAAMRSFVNYPHLLADALGGELTDLTVSGATTGSILDEPQVTMTGQVFPPQIDGLPADTDLITVTAGGNDLKFLGSMLFSAWERIDPTGPVARMLGEQFPDGLSDPGATEVEATAAGLARIVNECRSRAAGARVVLVDYLTILGAEPDQETAALFTVEQVSLFYRIQDALRQAYRLAADRTGADLVAVSKVSTDHALGSADPWIYGFESEVEKIPGAFHPNYEGMKAVAREISHVLNG